MIPVLCSQCSLHAKIEPFPSEALSMTCPRLAALDTTDGIVVRGLSGA